MREIITRGAETDIQAKQMKETNINKAGTPTYVRALAMLAHKVHRIQGDGNCFFRTLSCIMYGTEDHHASVRASIALFSELNADRFKQYCTSSKFMEHIRCMKH